MIRRLVAGTNGRATRPLVRLGESALAVVASLVIGALFLVVTGNDPLSAYGALAVGALGGVGAIAYSLVETTPLLLAALAVGLSFRSGFFNIGAGGQVGIGGLIAAGIGGYLHVPPALLIVLMLLGGACAGAVFGAIAGVLRAFTGASEIITTLMLNYVALLLIDFMVTGPWKASGGINQTPRIPAGARLPIVIPGTQLSIGILIALAAVVAVALLLRRTTFGYQLRMVGFNPETARAMGMSVRRIAASSLTLSGFLAGLAGAVEVAGVLGSMPQDFSIQVGFDAISASLLGGNSPLGILVASVFLGLLAGGAPYMEATAGVSAPFIEFLEGIIIATVVAFPLVLGGLRNRSIARRTARAAIAGERDVS
ncbi:MAG: ABC transporter permease [Candidatus Dormibacteraceae bacterium]